MTTLITVDYWKMAFYIIPVVHAFTISQLNTGLLYINQLFL